MYEIEIKLKNRKEYVKYYSMWASMNIAQKYGECYDVLGVVVANAETGEVGLIIEDHKLTYIASSEF